MPKNVRKRTRRMKPRIDAGDLKRDGDKVDFTYMDTDPLWAGDEGERFLDGGQITTIVGPSMANDPARHWLGLSAINSVMKGAEHATAAVLVETGNRTLSGDMRAAGFDTPDPRQHRRFHHWQPKSLWWDDGLGPSRARDRYEGDMSAHNHDLITIINPPTADPEEWRWMLNLGPDKTSHPALLILIADHEVDGDAWHMNVNYDSSFDFSARLTRDDEILSFVVQGASGAGSKKITFGRPKR